VQQLLLLGVGWVLVVPQRLMLDSGVLLIGPRPLMLNPEAASTAPQLRQTLLLVMEKRDTQVPATAALFTPAVTLRVVAAVSVAAAACVVLTGYVYVVLTLGSEGAACWCVGCVFWATGLRCWLQPWSYR
jgi:hypothetical protein